MVNLQHSIRHATVRQRPLELERSQGIGLVGAGNITNMHLRGYAWAGEPGGWRAIGGQPERALQPAQEHELTPAESCPLLS